MELAYRVVIRLALILRQTPHLLTESAAIRPRQIKRNMKSKAQWVADLMKSDGLTAEHLAAMSEGDRTNAVLSYFDAVGVRIENMQSQLLTRTQNLPAFRSVILSTLTAVNS